MMTSKEKYKNEKNRLAKKSDYWWEVIMGGILTSLILISFGGLVLNQLGLTSWLYLYSFICIGIVVYYQWQDDNLTVIKTGHSMPINFNLVTTSLDNLNWQFEKNTNCIDLTLNKYLLKFLSPTIIPKSEKIFINFKYKSTAKTGRLPFFFGISTYLEWTFKKTLKKTIMQSTY